MRHGCAWRHVAPIIKKHIIVTDQTRIMSVFVHFTLQDRVYIDGKYVNRHVRDTVVNKLRNSIEGVCSKHGLIRPGSVSVSSISLGVMTAEAGGGTTFNVTFDADVCNPKVGSIIKCRVDNINNVAAFAANAEGERAVEMIIPPAPKNFTHQVPFSDLRAGNVFNVMIAGKRFHLGQRKIVCAGQIVSAAHTQEGEALPPTTDAPITSQLQPIDTLLPTHVVSRRTDDDASEVTNGEGPSVDEEAEDDDDACVATTDVDEETSDGDGDEEL